MNLPALLGGFFGGSLSTIAPFFTPGGSLILGWLITLAVIVITVIFIVWLVTKFAGPPNIPEPFRWIIWLVAAIALLVFIFAALGIHLP